MSHIPYHGEDTAAPAPREPERPASKAHIRFGSNRRILEQLDL